MAMGLVLGAGGTTAWVFHTGVLRVLSDERGLDPADATIIVGTSAGAAVAAGVRAGVGIDEIYDAAIRPPDARQVRAVEEETRAARRSLRPLALRLGRHLLPGGRGPAIDLAGLLPPGRFPTAWVDSFPGMDRLDVWPRGLWVPAVRATDGEVIVFGRDRTDVPVSVAARASAAIPGIYQPRLIDGIPFVDGGVASSTHADLLIGTGVDLVAISAPMSKPSHRPFARLARARLATEVAALGAAGIETIVVEPPAEMAAAARGFPRRNPDVAPVIARHAAEAARLAFAAA
jgi:NTE family protein